MKYIRRLKMGNTNICEQFVSFDTAKMLKEAGFDVPCTSQYTEGKCIWNVGYPDNFNQDEFGYSRPTQALAARWLREAHNIDVMVDVYNRDYYVCHVYKNKHLMIIRNIVTSSFEKALEGGLCEAVKLIKK